MTAERGIGGRLTMAGEHISVIVPALNEAPALPELVECLDKTLASLTQRYEILVVDDGSEDNTATVLRELAGCYPHLHVVRFRRNYGKAAALSEGFARARGDYLITIDGDLQDRPEEIPRVMEQLLHHADVVCGWKQNRRDSWTRILSSRLFNATTRLLTGLDLHDINCGLKGYRRQVVQELKLYGEMHRFIPVIARQRGFTISEIPVEHRPRRYGHSRYGWSRPLSGLFDLVTLLMLGRYTHKPLHFFGLLGLGCTGLGTTIMTYLGIGWFQGEWIQNRPLFLVGIFFLLSGLQFIFFGLLAELLIFVSGRREECGIAEEIRSTEGESIAAEVGRPNGHAPIPLEEKPSPVSTDAGHA